MQNLRIPNCKIHISAKYQFCDFFIFALSSHMGVSLLLGTHRLPPPNPSCLRPECEFAIGLPEMKWRPSRIRGVQGGRHVGGVENCDISIGSWDGGWWKWCEMPMEWLYPRKVDDFLQGFSTKKWKSAWNGSSEEQINFWLVQSASFCEISRSRTVP